MSESQKRRDELADQAAKLNDVSDGEEFISEPYKIIFQKGWDACESYYKEIAAKGFDEKEAEAEGQELGRITPHYREAFYYVEGRRRQFERDMAEILANRELANRFAPYVDACAAKERDQLREIAGKLVAEMTHAMAYYKSCGDEAQPEYQLYKSFEKALEAYRAVVKVEG